MGMKPRKKPILTHVWAFLGYDDRFVATPGEPCCTIYTLSNETLPAATGKQYPREEVKKIAIRDLPPEQLENILSAAINNETLIKRGGRKGGRQ